MHNAIPRDGVVIFAVPAQYKENVSVDLNVFTAEVEAEFHVTEKEIKFSLESTDKGLVIKEPVNTKFIQALQAVDNGVMAMCQDEALAWMVETSSNVASVNTTERDIKIVASQRSNVMSNLNNMGNTIKALFELAGAEVTQGDKYPAWQMKQDSKLTQIVVDTYKKLFNKEPLVIGIHAGLECGLFSENIRILTWYQWVRLLEEYILLKSACLYLQFKWFGIIFGDNEERSREITLLQDETLY